MYPSPVLLLALDVPTAVGALQVGASILFARDRFIQIVGGKG